MKQYKVPIQSLIDHIKTACDVDPWAKEMAADLLIEQNELVRCKDCKHYVGNGADASKLPYWYPCKNMKREDEWYCADGERKTD